MTGGLLVVAATETRRHWLVRALRRRGAGAAASSRDALAVAKAGACRLVILDAGDDEGLSLVRGLAALPVPPAILAVAGDDALSADTALLFARAHGAAATLHLPCSEPELLGRVSEAVLAQGEGAGLTPR